MQVLADKYISLVREILSNERFEIETIGSVAYKIPVLDVEIAVYVRDTDWESILKTLESKFGPPRKSDKEFAVFQIDGEKYNFDIHLYTGYEGEVVKKLTQYMLSNQVLINEYKEVKEKYSFSLKEYKRQKNIFLDTIIKSIPDGY
jgi:hypothetical protein